jgi:hypothetical protein
MKYVITHCRKKGELYGVFWIKGKEYRVYQIQNETDGERFIEGIECQTAEEAMFVLENTAQKKNKKYKKIY